MHSLLHFIQNDRDFQAILQAVDQKLPEQLITGLAGSARHVYIAGLFAKLQRPLLVVTHSMQQAQQIYEDLIELLPDSTVSLFPEREIGFVDLIAYSPDLAGQRIQVMDLLTRSTSAITIAPLAAVHQPLVPKEAFRQFSIRLAVGQSIDLNHVLEQLVSMGYERVDMVETRGEFSVRGGILDIYPLNMEHAIRIELFDIEVDSIRYVDTVTQRSLEKVEVVDILPAGEILAESKRIKALANVVSGKWQSYRERIHDLELQERMNEYIQADIEKMQQGMPFPALLKYIHLLFPEHATILDYFGKDAIMILDEPTRLREVGRQLEREETNWQMAALERGELLPGLLPDPNYIQIFEWKQMQKIFMALFLRQVPGMAPRNIVNISAKTTQNFHGQMNLLKTEVDRWKKTKFQVVFLAGTRERAERLQRVLEDYHMETDFVSRWDETLLGSSRPILFVGNLQGGFELTMQHLVVITETEVFSNKKKARKTRNISDAQRIKNYQDLKVGDYVVHINHGIGQYLGVETLEIDGIHKDYLHLKYAGNDKLYVPVEQIDQVQKYVGSEEKDPKLYHLGGTEWARVKSKVTKSVRDIAQDLIQLYAERQATPGHAFSKDGPWQSEFEAMFPYEETTDQLKCIREIKKDMEQPRPMDRLLCGDVGYGKTEVAVRAAFKAVMDGYQVAVLVPTTILAQQHFETFRERFSGFPVQVEVVSRFKSRKQMTESIKKLKAGTIDIIIGTHRILNKDVAFKNLGLLIIDEEQRFGVSHKEKLKALKTNVDCLTLTATPIPRTLHMSMLGIRDLSVIETPPENRFPVQTYVVEYSEVIVREAIERELGRGGQVYFLFNRVNGIEQMADRIRQLVPEARVSVGHGRMGEEDLERVMLDFLQGDSDVLVSTTIIETGIDIPNVNTLIVYDADHMGLSQLYQLRGRVGRSNRIAYSYFTYQKDKVLTEVAEKRLQAIKEFTELGSGFKIAMRDLSIRGAGSLLGAEQHGHIASVGFDMYSEMLSQAVKELKGEMVQRVENPQIEIAVDAYIPSTYITDPMQKIEIYKKFVAARSIEDVVDLEEEIEDRFGDIPEEVRNLLMITKLRAYAIEYDFVSIVQQGHDVQMKLHERQNRQIDGEKLFILTNTFSNRMKLVAGQNILVTLRVKGLNSKETLKLLEQFMEVYKSVRKDQKEFQNVAQ
ncbi:transcription-repair coupling factor [Fodinisporobacter ferrooxydans]|uniref:Transcription-repair-coupling factor n=1 Tax=Fodinisporobacter ferrooxydans TaxID=2901836 RepID=A0ABY4CQH7_9BACL|nr:transcription-repair coupling factor [Alicyclobacillaceae bacterium MYW30-H2]